MGLRQKCLYTGIGFSVMAFSMVLVLGCEKNNKSASQQSATTPNSAAEMVEKLSAPVCEITEAPEEPAFELTESIKFADGTEAKSIAKADIEALRDRPIHMGGNDTDGVTLTNEKNDKVHVRTCREYDSAIQRGYFPYTTYDISMASWFKYPCGTLKLLQKAAIPQQSFISKPKEGIIDLTLLPLSLFPVLSDFEQTYGRNIDNVTYQDQVKKGLLKVTGMGENWLHCEADGLKQHLTEVARADFNGDGIEDILLSESVFATQGSFRSYKITILTRKSADGMFEIVQSHDP